MENAFENLLKFLQVKHTRSYSRKIYQEHPHKDNLLGLSEMLSDYNIENQGIRVKDKTEALAYLEAPFVAHVSGDFVAVEKTSVEQVEYLWKDKKITLPPDKFISIWSGVALLAEASDASIEPYYKENRQKEILIQLKHWGLFASILLVLGIVGIQSGSLTQFFFPTAAFINLTGAYIGYLLIQKQLKMEGGYADKICSMLLHQGDCNNVLESDAAKFLGFSWSEIGLGYFTANILLIICFPSLYSYVVLLNIIALPYSFWSVWYQNNVARQWCPLCLLVLSVLWAFFVFNLATGSIKWPDWDIHSILLTGCFYFTPIVLLNILLPQLTQSRKMEQIHQELNSLKADENIFIDLLKRTNHYPVDRSLGILWGNPNARNMITIITNPHCSPCARMHERLEDVIKSDPEGYCFQYILTSFNEELEKSNKLLIAMYGQKNLADYLYFLSDWYRNGKNKPEEFYNKYPFDPEDKRMLSELQKHKSWIEETQIRATPTILFNGYELPDRYKVEDLKHFSHIEIVQNAV